MSDAVSRENAIRSVLVVESSPRLSDSASRALTAQAVEALTSRYPGLSITRRDLAREPMGHLDDATVVALRTPPPMRTSEQSALLEFSDRLVDEVVAADLLVIGAPMHNFGIPSNLKAYIDYIARAGRTFRYGADGRPEGMLGGKPALILLSRGGIYSEGPLQKLDYQEPYLRAIFSFLGIESEFVRVEGAAFGPEAAAAGIAKAGKALLEAAALRGGAGG